MARGTATSFTVTPLPLTTGAQPELDEGVVADGTAILQTLPWYYHENSFMVALSRAFASEVGRLDEAVATVRRGAIPTTSDDEVGMLAEWETAVGLPVATGEASVDQRRANVTGALQAIGAVGAGETLAALRKAAGNPNISVTPNTPSNRVDTINHPFEPGSYKAQMLLALARRLWPAHRRPVVVGVTTAARFDEGVWDLDDFS